MNFLLGFIVLIFVLLLPGLVYWGAMNRNSAEKASTRMVAKICMVGGGLLLLFFVLRACEDHSKKHSGDQYEQTEPDPLDDSPFG